MGNPKQKWTSEEEEALRAGIAKYGPGKWKFIQKDPEFNQFLHSRSNIDLKDKWRNMSATGQGSRGDKLRTPKPKTIQDTPETSLVNLETLAPCHGVKNDSPADHVKDDPAKELPDGKNVPRYNELIFEALSNVNESNGLDIGSIFTFIEQRTEVPQNFRKQLGSKLRRLVHQEKIEKVENCYRIKSYSSSKANTILRKDNGSKQPLSAAQIRLNESLEEAAKTAAYKVAEAENASYLADEAIKEVERIQKMADEQAVLLQFVQDLYERCSLGEVILLE